ncbi:MAG: hypothetical protein IE889_05740 [Campylobacterales bacterium]|nr:hypothetical protein [Campylobacterales bacterium]
MTSIDRLAQQIDNLMHQLRTLKAENERLRKQLAMLVSSEETIAHLEEEKYQQMQEIIKLTDRLESLIKV